MLNHFIHGFDFCARNLISAYFMKFAYFDNIFREIHAIVNVINQLVKCGNHYCLFVLPPSPAMSCLDISDERLIKYDTFAYAVVRWFGARAR